MLRLRSTPALPTSKELTLRRSSMTRAAASLLLTATVVVLPAAATATPAAASAAVLAIPDLSLTNVRAHLQQFQTIANNNGGTRRSTTAGYTASQNYVFNALSAAGFTVVRQNCT